MKFSSKLKLIILVIVVISLMIFYTGDEGLRMISGLLLSFGGLTIGIISMKKDPEKIKKREKDKQARIRYEQKKKERIQMFEKEAKGKAFCPNCGCTDVQYISDTATIRGKQRTGIGLASAMMGDPVTGIIIGNSHKKDKIHHDEYCVCLKCGAKWVPQSIQKYLAK